MYYYTKNNQSVELDDVLAETKLKHYEFAKTKKTVPGIDGRETEVEVEELVEVEKNYIDTLTDTHTTTPPPEITPFQKLSLASDGWRTEEMNEGEKSERLDQLHKKIDAETESQILSGFKFDGKIFSMSLSAQANWLYLLTLYQGGQFPAEFSIATRDDSDYTLTKEQAPDFFQASAAHKESALAEGRKKKAELRSQYER